MECDISASTPSPNSSQDINFSSILSYTHIREAAVANVGVFWNPHCSEALENNLER